MKALVLFDIDGTLVWGGPAKDAFRVAMLEVFGTHGAIDGHEFSGKTDPQIARELLRGAGLDDADIDRGFPGLWDRYLEELEARLPDAPMELLAGVRELLDMLEAEGEVALGLLTGNIARGARAKLGSVGLDGRFPVGGFGSDSEIRDELPPIAMERAARAWGVRFPAERVVVVGDTPRDVACGRHHGTRTVGVATGHFAQRALEDAGADHTLEDLSGTERVVEILLG